MYLDPKNMSEKSIKQDHKYCQLKCLQDFTKGQKADILWKRVYLVLVLFN